MAKALIYGTHVALPENQVVVPVISSAASSASKRSRAAMSDCAKAAMYRSSTRRAPLSEGSARSSSMSGTLASRARARCSRLFKAATETSSTSAAPAGVKESTSQRINAARWRGGRTWSAATRARRTLTRAVTMAAGSPVPSITRWSGTGSSQRTPGGSCRGGARGSGDGGPSPDGIGRRDRRSSSVRQALVAIRYSQVRTEDRPSKRPNARQARR